MTPNEFKAWFEGFCESIGGPPTAEQFEKIKDKVKQISAVSVVSDKWVPEPYKRWDTWPPEPVMGQYDRRYEPETVAPHRGLPVTLSGLADA